MDAPIEVAEPSNKETTAETDPSKWYEQPAVTGRPNDEAPANSTLAERLAARKKQQTDAQNKAVDSGDSKAPAKRASRKKAS